jgi:uncharacterized protein YoxC
MAFDLSTAKPIGQPDSKRFDLSRAVPAGMPPTSTNERPKMTEAQFTAQYGDIPDIYGQITPNQPAPAPTLGQQAIGAGETALTALTGATGGTLGMIGGTLKGLADEIRAGEFGSYEAADRIEKKANELAAALTYQPRTEAGQEMVQELGEAASVLTPLAGLAGPAAQVGQLGKTSVSAMPKVQPILSAIDIPEIRNRSMIDAINSGSKKAANYIERGGKAVNSRALKKARDIGVIDDATSVLIKGSSAEDKKAALDMIKSAKRGLTDKKAQYLDRTYDSVGSALKQRVKTLDSVMDDYGKRIGALTKNMEGEVSLDNAVSNFTNKLYDDLSVRFQQSEGKFKPIFKGSAIEDNATAKRVVSRLVERIQSPKMSNPNYAHRTLKQYIDDQVNYGKTGEGLTGKADSIVKGFRSDINKTLQDAIPKYGELNSVYSKAADLKNAISDSIGRKVNLEDPRAMGTATRALGNNTQKRGNMINAINDIEDFSRSLGKEQKGDVMTQFIIADELDKLLGGQASTGLKGQTTGVAGEAVKAVAEPRSLISKAGKLLTREADTAEKLTAYEKAIKDMLRGQ